MPISTSSQQKSIVVPQGHHFTTPTGRWQVRRNGDKRVLDSAQTLTTPFTDYGEIEERELLENPDEELEDGFDDEFDEETIDLVPSKEGDALGDMQQADDYTEEEYANVPVVEIHLPAVSSESGSEPDVDVERVTDDPLASIKDDRSSAISVGRMLGNNIVQPGPVDPSHVVDATDPDLVESKLTFNAMNVESIGDAGHDEKASVAGGTTEADRQGLVSKEARPMWSIPPASTTHETYEPIDDREDVPSRRENVKSPTVVRLSDVPLTDLNSDQDDQATASEDDFHGLNENRSLKRKLFEIDWSDDSPQNKRTRANGKQLVSQPQQKEVDEMELHSNAGPDAQSFTNLATLRVSWKSPPTGESNHIRRRPKGAPQSRVRSTLALSSTPVRRSSRQASETPGRRPAMWSASHESGRPKVIFSSTSALAADKKILSTVRKLGGTVVTNIDEADVLCVGNGGIKKTRKFVVAIVNGKDIVTDNWLRQAQATQKFPDCDQFLPNDGSHEREWGFSLREAIDRGREGLKLLDGIHVHLTAQIRQDLGNLTGDLKHIAMTLGAAGVHSSLPRKDSKTQVVVVGSSSQNVDPEAAKVARLGHKLYKHDVLIMAAFRGRLELDSDEFLAPIPVRDEVNS